MKKSKESTAVLLLRIKDAATMLAVSEITIRRLVKAGKFKVCRVNSSVLIPAGELERFVKENTQ